MLQSICKKVKERQIKNMKQSLISYAFDYVNAKKEPVSFADIWAYVVKEAELTEEEAANRVASFYTNLMLDGRFVTLGENQWDLRIRQTFDKVHIDMKDVYSDVEESDEDVDVEDEEEKEYNEVFEEPKDEDSDDAANEEAAADEE